MDHREARKSFGSDSAQLVYGKRADGTLAHISEVARGLACLCICPACDGQLVARTKADFRVPHFAHNGGEACGWGPETALHLLAKELFRFNPTLFLPERLALDKQQHVFTLPAQEAATEFLWMEYTDGDGVIPDVCIRAQGHELFVEVAVTHFCEAEKVARLRKRGVPTIEIDLSKMPRDSTRDAIGEAVLRSATRLWLCHPNIDKAKAKLAEEERTRHEKIAKEHAATVERGKALAETYRAVADTFQPADEGVYRLEELDDLGLADYIGFDIAGVASFTVAPAVWQATILTEVFLDKALGNPAVSAVPITQHLEKAGLVRQEFKYIPGDVADHAMRFNKDFTPPWKAVDLYLKLLVSAGVLTQYGNSVALSNRLYSQANLCEEVAGTVAWILDQLPAAERGNMTADSWLSSKHPKSGKTFRAMLGPESDLVSGINAIVDMIEGKGPPVRQTFGLPVEGAIQRRRVRMALQAEERHAQQNAESFLNARDDDLGRTTPLLYVRDEETRRKVLVKLPQWQREFGKQ